MSNSVRTELGLEPQEMFHQRYSQKPFFTQGKQIHLMQSIHIRFSIFFSDATGDNDGPSFIGFTNAIQSKTTRYIGDGSEKTLKSLA